MVPGESILSHSERRNLTDLQETSQWLGGINVPKAILEQLFGTSLVKQSGFFLSAGCSIEFGVTYVKKMGSCVVGMSKPQKVSNHSFFGSKFDSTISKATSRELLGQW